jgi:hypothetical protein
VFLYDIFKVIYSPIKAFGEVLRNPRYVGPVLIIVISLFLTIGTQYVIASRQYVETITPTNLRDAWTNMTNPSSVWATNASVGNVTAYSNANNDLLAGNYSVQASVSNTSEILLRTLPASIGTINCSGTSGFKTIYYKLMYSGFNQTQAIENASYAKLRLFSLNNESDYFEFLLSNSSVLSNQRYLNKSQAWIDANVTLVSGWTANGRPSWRNITGIEFILGFPQKGQLSLYLNDLYFGGGKYEVYYDAIGLSYWLPSTVLTSVFDILLRWLIFAGLLWLTVKVFHSQGAPFRTLLIVVGYAFAIMFVYVTIDIFSLSQLPLLYFPNKVIFPLTSREISVSSSVSSSILTTHWASTAPYNIFIGIGYVSYAWTIGIFAIALKTLQNFSWKKAVLISMIAFIIALYVRAIIPV